MQFDDASIEFMLFYRNLNISRLMRVNLIHRKRDDQELLGILKSTNHSSHRIYVTELCNGQSHIVLPCFVRVPMHNESSLLAKGFWSTPLPINWERSGPKTL